MSFAQWSFARGLRVSGEDLVSAEAEIRHVFGDKNLTEVK